MTAAFAPILERAELNMEARAGEAVRVLRSMPLDVPGGYVSGWPETLRDRVDVMALVLEQGGRHEDMRPPRFIPSAAAIDRADQFIGWLMAMTVEERKLIFGAAAIRESNQFRKWKVLGKRIGISAGAAKERHRRAIGKLVKIVIAKAC
jgi:hypothetical protein